MAQRTALERQKEDKLYCRFSNRVFKGKTKTIFRVFIRISNPHKLLCTELHTHGLLTKREVKDGCIFAKFFVLFFACLWSSRTCPSWPSRGRRVRHVTAISLLLAHSVLAVTDYIVPPYCPCSRTIYGLWTAVTVFALFVSGILKAVTDIVY